MAAEDVAAARCDGYCNGRLWSMDVPCSLSAQTYMVSVRHRLEEPNEIKKVPFCGEGGWAQKDLLCTFAGAMLA